MVVSALVYLARANRYIGVGLGEYARAVLLPGIAPYLIGLICAWLARPWLAWAGTGRWQLMPVLAVFGVIYSLSAVAFLYWVMCDWAEREDLRERFFHTVRGVLPLKGQPA
jgi:hypothetical protein